MTEPSNQELAATIRSALQARHGGERKMAALRAFDEFAARVEALLAERDAARREREWAVEYADVAIRAGEAEGRVEREAALEAMKAAGVIGSESLAGLTEILVAAWEETRRERAVLEAALRAHEFQPGTNCYCASRPIREEWNEKVRAHLIVGTDFDAPHSAECEMTRAALAGVAPMTWNEAAHSLRAAEAPEDFGHADCPDCEEARRRRSASREDVAAIRAFAAEMQASTGDDLGPMIWRDVQRLADDHERSMVALRDLLDTMERGDEFKAFERMEAARAVLAEKP